MLFFCTLKSWLIQEKRKSISRLKVTKLHTLISNIKTYRKVCTRNDRFALRCRKRSWGVNSVFTEFTEQVLYLVYLAENWESTGTKEVLLQEENTPTNHLTKMWTQPITVKICMPSGTEFVSLPSICLWLNNVDFEKYVLKFEM